MTFDDRDDNFTLSSGRQFYAYGAILGIGPKPAAADDQPNSRKPAGNSRKRRAAHGLSA
jgi:hypothetical protein